MKTRKSFMVDTGNNIAWFNTLDEAITDYNFWTAFYEKNFKAYGEKTITLSKNHRIIYSTDLFMEPVTA